jgi:hypothetical protein
MVAVIGDVFALVYNFHAPAIFQGQSKNITHNSNHINLFLTLY